jgi:purine-nucleoside phosphorylase
MFDVQAEQERIEAAVQEISARAVLRPRMAIVLGSGLGPLADKVDSATVIPYSEIPGFPSPSVPGHEGRLVLGTLAGIVVAVLQGRCHYYEGHPMADVVRPVRVLRSLGARDLLVTNAAGGINESFRPGDLMLISDHLNLMGVNPLRGPNIPDLGPRFPDMTRAYDNELRQLVRNAAASRRVPLREGVYAALSGPSYETPAEIRMLRALGADAVGMSTVPEVIVARHMGMRVVGISCVTNLAAGISDQPLSHREVQETANRVAQRFQSLVLAFLSRYSAPM